MTSGNITGMKIRARGIVQGVGFRPFVYSQAVRLGLTGWVRNTSSGVEIEINGSPDGIDRFLSALEHQLPPLARIDHLENEPCSPNGYDHFEIISSQPQPGEFIPVSPDTSICKDCQHELLDPNNRRFRYPFINCTNCGPRFSIIRDIPYDRPKTTMAQFEMCPDCQREYENPLDRRFHAQPTACPVCGPQLWFEANNQQFAEKDEALQLARQWLKEGKILAVKGLGGFHLACDASNAAAVSELRRRKKRSDKPFALMAFDLETIRHSCIVSEEEAHLLESHQRPIVLLEQKPDSSVAEQVAPQQSSLGIMLAYTPLHLLLLEPSPGFPDLLVMTSANLSEEPIAYEDQDALQRLSGLADGFLMHNRPIHMRVDDSVVRVFQKQIYPLRRARGFAPDPIHLPVDVKPILAAGAELKNTFCLTRDRYAFLSHHIGDLENFETLRSFEEGISHFERLFRIKPEVIACDLHPNYLATRYAQARAKRENLPLVEIQHHHAHLAACLADNGWDKDEPVIGLCFDGTGYGTDGTVWGGEVLFGNYRGYERHYHLAYAPLPGGDLAVRKPSRMALSHLWQVHLNWEQDYPAVAALCAEERTILRSQLEHHLNTPLTSSMGRLFDAAAALIGIRQNASYEGQAAIELEIAADPQEDGSYPFEFSDGLLDPTLLWQSLLADWHSGTSIPILSARFHNSIVTLCLEVCRSLRSQTGCKVVAFSGGVWQNMFLLDRAYRLLSQNGFQVLVHHQVPANDGGIALGQAVIAAHFIANS
jgi:hydrogenase maturation protein HypF